MEKFTILTHLDAHAEGDGDGEDEYEEGEDGEDMSTQASMISLTWNKVRVGKTRTI